MLQRNVEAIKEWPQLLQTWSLKALLFHPYFSICWSNCLHQIFASTFLNFCWSNSLGISNASNWPLKSACFWTKISCVLKQLWENCNYCNITAVGRWRAMNDWPVLATLCRIAVLATLCRIAVLAALCWKRRQIKWASLRRPGKITYSYVQRALTAAFSSPPSAFGS